MGHEMFKGGNGALDAHDVAGKTGRGDRRLGHDSTIAELQRKLAAAEARERRLRERLRVKDALARLGLAAEHVGDSIEFTDAQGIMQWVNPAYESLTGYTRDEVLGKTPAELLRSDAHPPEFYEEIWNTTSSGRIWKGLMTSRRKDGSEFTADCTLSPVLDDAGDVTSYMCLRRDVTAEVHERLELRSALSRYALAAAGANDGMWGWDLEQDEVLLSARWRLMLGYPPREFRGAPSEWLQQVHPDERSGLEERLKAHLDGATDHLECEYRIRHRDGGWRWMLCRGLAERGPDGKAARIAGSQADITRQKTAELRLRHEALHDALTGLPNRVLFEDRLEQSLLRAARHDDRRVAVLFVDLDKFKKINDSYGHAAGDRLLQEIGRRLQRALRSADTVARIGGDEFTVLIDAVRDQDEVDIIIGRIQEAIALPVLLAGANVVVSASIGMVLSRPDDRHPNDLLRDADTAMYQAKAAGRDRTVTFVPEMRAEVLGLVELEQELRAGMAAGQLRLHYQPIVSLPDRTVVGFEALVRWERPGFGLLLPGEFLHVAEEARLMDDLERWVLDAACNQIASWRLDGGLPAGAHVAVNISPKRLLQSTLLTQVEDALDRTGIPPHSLRLEITENSLLEDELAASAAVHALRGLGVRVCLDDFGTGYSSLAYIHRFSVDVLKIDRAFTAGLTKDAGSEAIVKAIVGMARGLGLEVVAEGVETEEQLERLIALGCDGAQGYLLGRPGGA